MAKAMVSASPWPSGSRSAFTVTRSEAFLIFTVPFFLACVSSASPNSPRPLTHTSSYTVLATSELLKTF